MNKTDIELTNKIMELTKKIFNLYNTLYELEVNRQNDSNLYKKNLEYLNLLIEMEDELYKKIPLSRIREYMSYINHNKHLDKFSDFTIIINDYTNMFISKRIYNKLNKLKTSYLIKRYQKSELDIEPNYDINTMLNSFIFETNEMRQNMKDNPDFQNGLMSIKYLMSFFNKNIENNLKKDFKLDDTLFFYNRLMSDMHGIEEKDYKEIFIKYYFHFINKELNNITKKDLYTSDHAFQEYRLLLVTCLINAFSNISFGNTFLKNKIYDIINESSIDLKLIKSSRNAILLRTERLELNGSSK